MTRGVLARWTAAWLGGAVIGTANGIVREKTYARFVGEHTAHNLSGATAIAAFAAYFRTLDRRWPIPTSGDAARIGATWLLLTVAFEFTFGRLVAKMTWTELLADYDVRTGRTWPFVLAWIAVGPAAVRAVRGDRATSLRADQR